MKDARGQFESLLEDPSLAEIYVEGTKPIRVRNTTNNGRVIQTDLRFMTDAHLRDAINELLSREDLQITPDRPMIAKEVTGGRRIYATIPPVVASGPTLTIINASRWDESGFEGAPGWGIACKYGLFMYDFAIAREESDNVAVIKATERATSGSMATVCQGIRGFGYRGSKIELSADLKLDEVDRCGLFIRADNADRAAAAISNMWECPLKGTSDWMRYAVTVNVPADATFILFGFWLDKKGTVCARNFKLNVIVEAPKTRRKRPPRQCPVNLDFSGQN